MTATPCRRCGNELPEGAETCPVCDTPVAAGPRSPVAGWEGLIGKIQEATGAKYRVVRLLGYGGMAGVYLADEPMLGRRVAIKVMTPGLMMDADLIDRFHQEARTIARLNHPNIVTIYDIGGTGDLHYFAMTYVPGRTLAQVVSNAGALPFDVTRAWLSQMADALGYAHRHDIIHRDIKPGNILLDGDGNVHVTDFGIAKVADAPKMTRTGLVVGTPIYMSPEQCAGDRVTGASDQYALGSMAYEMLTGAPPFEGPALSVMHAHLGETPKPLRERRPDCPSDLEEAVLRMLAKDPAERWPDLADFVRAIGGRSILHDDDVTADMAAFARPVNRIEVRTDGASEDDGVAMAAGETKRLTVRVLGPDDDVLNNRRITWASENPDVAEVEPDGTVVGRRPGIARIVAKCEGRTARTGVRVEDLEVDTLEIALPEPRLEAGASGQASARATAGGRDLSRSPITWLTSDPDVATVTGEGRITAVGPGTAVITAKYGRKEASASLIVQPPRAAAPKATRSGSPGLDAAALGIERPAVEAEVPPTVLAPVAEPPRPAPATPAGPPAWRSPLALAAFAVAVLAIVAVFVMTRPPAVSTPGAVAGDVPTQPTPGDGSNQPDNAGGGTPGPVAAESVGVARDDTTEGRPPDIPATPQTNIRATPPPPPPAVPVPVVTRLEVRPDLVGLEVGGVDTVVVRALSADGIELPARPTWQSQDPAILRVVGRTDGSAVVEALAPGRTAIEILAGDVRQTVPVSVVAVEPPPLVASVSGARASTAVDVDGKRIVLTSVFTPATNRPGPWCAAASLDVSGRPVAAGTRTFQAGDGSPARLEFPVPFGDALEDVPSGERTIVASFRLWPGDCNEERGPPIGSAEAPPVCLVRFPLRDWQQEDCR